MDTAPTIFLSHASINKAIVVGICNYLPTTMSSWLDAERLVWGMGLEPTFKDIINSEADYVAVFLDHNAANSKWVHQEVKWALEKQESQKRTLLLPISLYADKAEAEQDFPELFQSEAGKPKYITVKSSDKVELERVASEITAQVIALQHAELVRLRNPAEKRVTAIEAADSVLEQISRHALKELFVHRKDNPIDIDTLRLGVQNRSGETFDSDEFELLLSRAMEANKLRGVVTDGYEYYLETERVDSKERLNHDLKQKIARKVSALVRSGMSIYLDAGSSTAEIAKVICKRVKSNSLANLTVVAASISHADMISRTCVEMGYDDNYTAVKLYVLAGKVRPGTQAIVPTGSSEDELADIANSIEGFDGFDIVFLGASGISEKRGVATSSDVEAMGKREAVRLAKRVIVVSDSSKIGLELPETIADVSNEKLKIYTAGSDWSGPGQEMRRKYGEDLFVFCD